MSTRAWRVMRRDQFIVSYWLTYDQAAAARDALITSGRYQRRELYVAVQRG